MHLEVEGDITCMEATRYPPVGTGLEKNGWANFVNNVERKLPYQEARSATSAETENVPIAELPPPLGNPGVKVVSTNKVEDHMGIQSLRLRPTQAHQLVMRLTPIPQHRQCSSSTTNNIQHRCTNSTTTQLLPCVKTVANYLRLRDIAGVKPVLPNNKASRKVVVVVVVGCCTISSMALTNQNGHPHNKQQQQQTHHCAKNATNGKPTQAVPGARYATRRDKEHSSKRVYRKGAPSASLQHLLRREGAILLANEKGEVES
eukprot:TRINITY_DN65748_c5_g3_i1.p2 TRINITY_DN65748_c5_g3~~TRINITY_DN65748_c5_g3_i1.p2  ORF type:complete len:260 (+),score=26.09 TRINITY_DN65748_c5_g3_i1:828-1607(+)